MAAKTRLTKAMKPSNQKYTKEGMSQMTFTIDKMDMFKFKVACLVMEKKKIAEVLRQLVKDYTEKIYRDYEMANGGEIDFFKLK